MKKNITQLLLILFLFSSAISIAQDKKIDKADEKYNQYSFVKAIDIYEKVVSKGYKSAEILKKLGNAYYFNADYDNASKWYGELMQMKDSVIEPDYYFRYAQSLKSLKEYNQADAMMAKFDDLKDKDIRAQIFENKKEYLEFIKLQSGRYTIESFPHNSEYSDFAPSFLKGNLVFSSARDTGSLRKRRHSWNEMPFLDLYGGELDKDKVIGVQKFSRNINTRMHESSTAFTKDGETVYFTRNNFVKSPKYGKDGINRLKVYKAVKDGDEWTNIVELPFNSDDYSVAHPALSPDESKLYFASDMPGSTGESDIYVVSISEDGSYGMPKNLGTNINTEARETFPYVSESGLLYFASDGHQGLGGLDVYVTKVNEGNTEGEIINVGEPVNSPEDDFSFVINESTKIGFFASNREGGLGSDDIYTFTEHSPVIFSCNQLVTGVVRDKDTNEVLPDAIVYVIDENNNEVSRTTADDVGRYSHTINCKKGHFIRAAKEGYETKEEFLAASFSMQDRTLDFYLEKSTVTAISGDDLAKILDLKPIYFDFDKANIRPDAELELQKVIAALEKYPTLKIDVRSHTDSRGVDAYNLKLSDRRAKSTVQYIIDKGIDASRISGKGYGEIQPVNECKNGVPCSKEQHQLNRRSEFIIMN